MGHRIQWLCLLSMLVIALGTEVTNAQGTTQTCADGWSFYRDQCYLMRDEYEEFGQSENTCELFGAGLAYAKDRGEFNFINGLISKQNAYGWWYGAKIRYDGKPLVYDKLRGYYYYAQSAISFLPKEKELKAPSTRCIGLVRDNNLYRVEYIMTDVPCDVNLPYVCRGEPSGRPIPPADPHRMQNNTQDEYWFSSLTDRRSHDDAVKACQAKGKTLLSIRGDPQMTFLMEELDKRQDNHADPWWIGLQVQNGVYSWSSGVNVENSIINWNRKAAVSYYGYRKKQCRILLTDGTMDDRVCFNVKAPFICKRPHLATGQFGCPPNWSRAGQSCYIHASKKTRSNVIYGDAEKTCSKLGGHPISIDTPLEKLWLKQSRMFEDNRYQVFWTTLNDKKNSGHFVWANSGKTPNPSVLAWSAGTTMDGIGQCFAMRPQTGVITRRRCNYSNYPGCQHPANGPVDCVTTNWKYYMGHCYYDAKKEGYAARDAYPTMMHHCYADAVTKNTEIVISPLKADRADIVNFYAKNLMSTQYGYVWLGLQEKSKGVFTWADGTPADLSVFSTEYYTLGTDNSTSKCAVVDRRGEFLPKSCSTCICGQILCEKEVSFQGGTGSGDGNGAATVSNSVTTILAAAFLALLTLVAPRFLTAANR